MSLNSFAQPLAGAAAGAGAGRKRGELEGVEQGSHHGRAPFPREGMTERAGRGATGKGRYDSGRRLEGAACRDLCLRAAGAWPVSQAKSKPVDGGPRRSPAHADLLPQPAPWPLPLTVRVGLGHHHLLLTGQSLSPHLPLCWWPPGTHLVPASSAGMLGFQGQSCEHGLWREEREA